MTEIILAVIVLALIALLAYREHQTRSERADLLDRIQAPEVVVQRRMIETAPPLEPEEPDMGPWGTPEIEDDEQ